MHWAGRLGRWEQRGLQPPPFPLEPRKGEARPAGPPQVTHGQEVRRSPGSGRRAAAQTDGQTGFSLCSGSRGPAVLPPVSGLGHRAAEAPTAPPPFQVHSVLETRRLPAVFWALGQRARVRKAPDGPCLGLCWDQPSHTLPPAQRSACHGRVARADMSTGGPRTGLRPQYPLPLADALFTARLPLHVLVLEEPRHRPVCTAQARGRCWHAAKQRIGTHV